MYVAQADEHQRIEWIGGGVMSVLFDGASTGGQLMVLRTTLRRGEAAPVHVHGPEDEMFVVLRGEVLFWVGDERHEVREGGVVFLPRGVPHAYRVASEEAELLTLATPAGLEAFFRAVGHDLSQPKPEGWAIAPAAIGQAMAQFGGRVVGPPPADAR